jgi:hypothetical protein
MKMPMWRLIVAAMWLVAARAANAGDLEIESPAAPLSCLTSVRPEIKAPAYPVGVLEGTNAVVRVKLNFTSSDQAPTAEVSFNNAGPAFAAAVRDHVRNYRLPCLVPGSSFSGVQEFQFVVKNSVHRTLQSATRGANGEPILPPECFAGIENVPPPTFPSGSITFGSVPSGTVVAQFTFTTPDRAPEVRVLYDGGDRRLEHAVRDSVEAYRWACLRPGDEPLVATRTFEFWRGDDDRVGLNSELTLVQLLGLAKDLKKQTVRFDFTTMGCPFQLSVVLYQPWAKNRVRQVGDADPGRREFTEWLRNVTFVIPPRAMKTVIGTAATVSVPCALLDLS